MNRLTTNSRIPRGTYLNSLSTDRLSNLKRTRRVLAKIKSLYLGAQHKLFYKIPKYLNKGSFQTRIRTGLNRAFPKSLWLVRAEILEKSSKTQIWLLLTMSPPCIHQTSTSLIKLQKRESWPYSSPWIWNNLWGRYRVRVKPLLMWLSSLISYLKNDHSLNSKGF